jgi:site-specific DNA recombinase
LRRSTRECPPSASAKDQTIQSQTAALRELAEQRDLVVSEEFIFEDDGFSGANLQRPAQLRDRAFDGCFEVVLCHAPDRLARRYAYQVLLLEELARGGIEVVFVKEPERSGSPEDELLRQFQGMIAEYERAQIAERCRRGKLHRARAGAVSVLSGAPYGYRYVKRTEHADAFYEIDELEAPIVRDIFDRYVEQRESIVQIGKRTKQGAPTRTGTPHWGSSTIWAILRNPAYIGQAAYGRRRSTGEPAKPMRRTRQQGRRSGRYGYEVVGPEHWLRIPVPALISEVQHALAQELLARNSRLSPRNTRKPSLLQGILVCRECGHSYYRSSTRSKTGNVHHYYRCSGADSFRRPEGRVCAARPVRIDEVDEPVWAQVLALLENPELIKAEIDRRLQALRSEHPATRRRDGLQRDLTRAQKALRRLIDGYQEQLITLEELRARMPELRRREATLRAELDALDTELHDAETYLKLTETLDAFRTRLSNNAMALTIEQRQEIVRLVVREVLLGDDNITVRHSIPVPNGGQPGGSLLRSQSQGAAQGCALGVRRRAGAALSVAQRAQRSRSHRRARPPTDQGPAAKGVAGDRLRPGARAAPGARRRARAHPPRRRRLAAGGHGGDADRDSTRDQGQAPPHAGVHQPVRVDDRHRPYHAAQRQALVLRRDGTALDRRRDARSREAVPQGDRLHPATAARDRDRTTTPPSPAQPDHDPGSRHPSHCVTITPGPSSPKFHDGRGNLAPPEVSATATDERPRCLGACQICLAPFQVGALAQADHSVGHILGR